MERLPKEPYLLVMSYLSVFEKLTCIRVCRQWQTNVLNRVLFFGSLTFGVPEWNQPTNFDKLRKAVTFYNTHKILKRQVLSLTINGRLDFELLLSLPSAFPRLKSLTLKDMYTDMSYDNNENIPLLSEFSSKFGKLKHLECLEVSATSAGYQEFPLSNYILGSTVFSDLTRVQISISRSLGINSLEKPISVKPLIDNLCSVPALIILELTGFEIGIMDMEKLHDYAVRLREIKLNQVQLAPPERDDITVYENGDYIVSDGVQLVDKETNQSISRRIKPRVTVYIPLYKEEDGDGGVVDGRVKMEENKEPSLHALFPPRKLQMCYSLGLLIINIKENGKDPIQHYNETTLVKWYTYIAVKYTSLYHINVVSAPLSNVMPPVDPLDELIIKIASNMSCIKNLNLLGMYPLSEKIVKGFDNIDADWVSLHTQITSDFVEETSIIRKSKQKGNIKKWTITDWTTAPIHMAYIIPSIIDTGKLLENLTTLDLIGQQYHHRLFIEIIHSLPWVETLSMGAIFFENDAVSTLRKPMVHPSRLKQLRVGFISREQHPHYYFNCLFRVVFRDCLQLEQFTLRGTVLRCLGGMLDFNFGRLEYLKMATIDLQGVRYFKLNSDVLKHSKRVYWARQNTFYTGDEQWPDTDGHAAYANVTWCGNIILNLEGSGSDF
ncbi:unnamed protein product [Mucor hiemalis]